MPLPLEFGLPRKKGQSINSISLDSGLFYYTPKSDDVFHTALAQLGDAAPAGLELRPGMVVFLWHAQSGGSITGVIDPQTGFFVAHFED